MAGGEDLRVGVVGVGYLGQHHARIYAAMPGVTLAGVADTDAARAAEVGDRYRARACADYRELLPGLDAASVATPTVSHFEVVRDLLEAGVDVLVEKPMAQRPEQAEALVEVARRTRRILQVGHVERFNAAVREAARWIRDPGFIEVHRLGAFVDRSTDVDVVLDLMIHDIDVILSLVRSPVREVRAKGVPVLTERVDIANARLEFEGGCVANVTASRVSMHPQRKIRVFQPDAYLSLDFQAQELACYRRIPDPAGGRPRIVQEPVRVPREEPLQAELAAFVRAVRTRERPVVSGEDGLRALAVAEEIRGAIARSA